MSTLPPHRPSRTQLRLGTSPRLAQIELPRVNPLLNIQLTLRTLTRTYILSLGNFNWHFKNSRQMLLAHHGKGAVKITWDTYRSCIVVLRHQTGLLTQPMGLLKG